ncbi:hypothetical protein PHYSODRAFT_476323 [Phytophthora sojae]|uniref:DDE-1 domain-containing protein n=1 Tax=Phytophthora sojae (strain P6497) TaxID=1094619 RepID=G4YIE9_PHYSP|nr:hypothetical protein PHYSODRAFT_476323 [Phytophthora sojae]EGZ27752.1 hypothetical protein PHYSODRAFT_476323 [Phytophthora sojae]|eukprot:XP_009515027.1 hypothetical protein PHYSODRAFT_476323 [Phytophthora sojae]
MWNDSILLEHAEAVICSRPQTRFYRRPVLYIIDSYGCHVVPRLGQARCLEKKNRKAVIYLAPNMYLNVLETIHYLGHLGRFGHIFGMHYQLPPCQHVQPKPFATVQHFCLDWVNTQDADTISKAFRVCGLTVHRTFDMEGLHPSLRDLLNSSIQLDEWYQKYENLRDEDDGDDREEICINPPHWYIPSDIPASLFLCLYFSLASAVYDYKTVLTEFMTTLEDLAGLLDDDYLDAIRDGRQAIWELELFAALRFHSCNIDLKTLNYNCRVISTCTYTVPDAARTINMARIGLMCVLKVDGMQVSL